jgi:hypothetical protein
VIAYTSYISELWDPSAIIVIVIISFTYLWFHRMKTNIVGMEANMEQLLAKV